MNRRTISWIDIGSNERQTYLTAVASCSATFVAMLACTNCIYTNFFEGNWVITAHPGPSSADYVSIGNVVSFDENSSVNIPNRVFVPAPKLNIFLADRQTVDFTVPSVIVLDAAMSSELANPLTCDPVIGTLAGWMTRQSRSIREAYIIGGSADLYAATVVWLDAQGRTTSIRLVSTSGTPTTRTAMESISNASILSYWEGPASIGFGMLPTSDVYAGVLDTLVITAADPLGNLTNIMVPAPKLSCFLADGETMDAGDSNVSTLLAAIVSELAVPQSGLAVQSVLGGQLRRARGVGIV